MPEFYHAPSPLEGASTHVFIATPTIGIACSHMAAVVRAIPLLMGKGIGVDHFLLDGCVHVDDARNICVARFLETKADSLVFLDADVSFPPEALYRLVSHEGDIVAGVYPRKQLERSYPFQMDEGTAEVGPDGLFRDGVSGLPTGFMKISRRVLERMAELRVDRMFRPFGDAQGPMVPVIFERTYDKGKRLSGDYAFCAWARELGFQLALDPYVTLAHEGTMKFQGCLAVDLAASAQHKANGAAA